MNHNEAFSILGIEEGASMDEVRKAFRKKAAEFHPDRNKDPGAEDKFKTINEASQFLEKNGTTAVDVPNVDFNVAVEDIFKDIFFRQGNGGMPFNGAGIPFGGRRYTYQTQEAPPIVVSLEVPFDMFVTGGKKEVRYLRNVKCTECSNGKKTTDCIRCAGKGYRKYGEGPDPGTFRRVGSEKELPCTTCKGTGKVASGPSSCDSCGSSGFSKSSFSTSVSIPPGIQNGVRLIVPNVGNYNSNGTYDPIHVAISVIPDKDMQLAGIDVISVVEVSLLEALKGTKKRLRTVRGEKTLAIPPKTKNKDTIKVHGFGVPPMGSHVFCINVSYPDDVQGLIDVLDKKETSEVSTGV